MSTKMARNQQTSSLPLELVAEILVRLPAKSILRFKRVSKSWQFMINSKRFVKIHLQHASRNTKLLLYKRIRYTKRGFSTLPQISLFDNPNFDAVKLINFPTEERVKSIFIVGCCNGLVCLLLNDEHFMLWNPSTRDSKQLPPMTPITTHRVQDVFECYGFGYDESSDDYKVLYAFMLNDIETACKLYSLKTGSWKIIVSNLFHVCCFTERGKLVSGNLHWVSRENSKIVAFDLKIETYVMFEQPALQPAPQSTPPPYWWPNLGKLRDCLSLLYLDQSWVDVWVMNEYGVKESWEKVMAVDLSDSCSSFSPTWFPFWIGRGEEVMVLQMPNLLIFRPKREDSGYELVKIVNNKLWDEMHSYSESLISLW